MNAYNVASDGNLFKLFLCAKWTVAKQAVIPKSRKGGLGLFMIHTCTKHIKSPYIEDLEPNLAQTAQSVVNETHIRF